MMVKNITDIHGKWLLHNQVEMPYLGLGIFQIREGNELENAVNYALEAGYRHFDTASLYGNEKGLGKALKSSGINRKDLFVTSKVWNTDQRNNNVLKAFNQSLDRLGFEYLDLFLVHWPVPEKINQSWEVLEQLFVAGRVKAIGVSNFMVHHLKTLINSAHVLPMVNQVEFHPYLVNTQLIDFCSRHGIQMEAWSPLMQGKIVDVKELQVVGKKYGKNPAQVVLRWNLQKGFVTIPKSSNKERIFSNANLFDFSLTDDEMVLIDKLDRNNRFGEDPDNLPF